MKKYLLILTLTGLSAFSSVKAQKFAASVSNTGTVLTFKMKPDVNVTTGFSTIEFFLRYPTSSPAFTYGTVTANTVNFPGMTATGVPFSGAWEIEHNNPFYVLPGFNVDHFIYTGPAPNTTSRLYTAGVEYDVFSVPLSGASGTVDFQFIHDNTETYYYLAITSQVGTDLRPLALNDYFYPATSTAAGPSGSTFYFMALNSVPVPVKFNGFSVIKKDNDGILSWSVENESATTDRYEIERSFNGLDFTKIATVASKNNGFSSNTYSLTDINIAGLKHSGLIYYRIKQIDKDGKFVYSEIRNVKLDGKGIGVNVFPNPVKDVATITVDLEEKAPVAIIVTDAAGKEVYKEMMAGAVGLNVKKVNMTNMAAGSYQIKIIAGTEIKLVPVVKAN